MGMRIGGAAQAGATQGTGAAQWQQRQQGVKDLMAALQSGDLATAQKAWSGLSANGGSTRANGPLAAIGKALQSGDLAGAQQAAQDWKAQRAGHHHHMATATATTAPISTDPGSAPGSIINVKA